MTTARRRGSTSGTMVEGAWKGAGHGSRARSRQEGRQVASRECNRRDEVCVHGRCTAQGRTDKRSRAKREGGVSRGVGVKAT